MRVHLPWPARSAAERAGHACYAPTVIQARGGRARLLPARFLLSMVAVVAMAVACDTAPSTGPGTPGPDATSTAEASPTGSEEPTPSPTPTESAVQTATPVVPTASPATTAGACSGSDANRAFFDQAAASMAWPVYCAVLPQGWFLEVGSFRLADGGRLEVTYHGPDDARLELREGSICAAGTDVDTCAPRDAVIGPAMFGDREGELARLSSGLVLDVDRGATPSWRATGLGLTEDAFRAICAAFIVVEG